MPERVGICSNAEELKITLCQQLYQLQLVQPLDFPHIDHLVLLCGCSYLLTHLYILPLLFHTVYQLFLQFIFLFAIQLARLGEPN